MRLFFLSKSNVFYLGWEEKNNLNIAQKANMRVKQFSNKINYFWIKSLNGGLVFQWRNVRRKKYSVLWVNQNSLEAEKCFIFVYSGFYSTKNSLTELIFSMFWRPSVALSDCITNHVLDLRTLTVRPTQFSYLANR